MRHLCCLAVFAVSLVACEAHTTVQTRFVLPRPLVASEAALAKLHVSVLSATSFTSKLQLATPGKCPAFDASRAPRDKPRILLDDGQFMLEQSDRPSVSEFCVAAWFDANGNSTIDPGDAVGNLAAPYPVQPSTFLGSNSYDSPPVELTLVK